MWPVTIAVGVYYVCKGIQEAMDESREKNLQLTHKPRKQLLSDPFNGSIARNVTDCYEEVCDERY